MEKPIPVPADPQRRPGDEDALGEAQTGENVCPACAGSGRRDGGVCPACGGTGRVVEIAGDA